MDDEEVSSEWYSWLGTALIGDNYYLMGSTTIHPLPTTFMGPISLAALRYQGRGDVFVCGGMVGGCSCCDTYLCDKLCVDEKIKKYNTYGTYWSYVSTR